MNKPQHFVIFHLSGSLYAMPVSQVREVHGEISIEPVPGTADFVKGITVIRDNALPVIDLKELMRISIPRVDSNSVGDSFMVSMLPAQDQIIECVLIVETVVGVSTFNEEDIQPSSSNGITASRYVSGIHLHNGKATQIIDTPSLFSNPKDFEEISQIKA
ncbi:chemotaxis protein CheW [Marispirochaeta sp.]|uniref:chemotaxis protein CheW n=1 Tax=Marispirochaeta sp. TaxID=2038653 RepID=UPI0029C7D2D0|nr:chemotaxis protein CheW [Marispirochaeta sp.]